MEIKDSKLDPYFIKVQEDSYDLMETVVKGAESKTPGQAYSRPVGYFPNLSSVLAKVSKLKVIAANNETGCDLAGFINQYNNSCKMLSDIKI
jgi:hypothetical protein